MKKYFITAMVFLATTTAALAQKKHKSPPPKTTPTDSAALVNKALQSAAANSTEQPKPKKVWDLSKRSADHFMFELGYDNWAGKPDSANISGFNHSLNFYFMMDFPFKTDQRLSMGVGLGLGSSQIYFNKTYPQIAAYNNLTLTFATSAGGGSAAGADHYKRFKLVTNYLEIPVELRFALDPEHMDKSWKFAVGTKIGLLLTAYTKSVDPEDVTGHVLANVVEKESSKQFFSSFKFAPTFRVSKGVIGIFGQFQVNSLLKGSAGYTVFPFSGGVVLSGL
ncbi:MAG TPA: outer membrane beta-barrel protein [Puia sp.]|nr:outer membrane beta-barrel protein [Puia sp.]